MCGNFIKIDRKIKKWEWWSDINTFRVFVYMLISAYWKDGNYKGVKIPRGSFPSSISDLAKETNLTENEIRTTLKHLKTTGEITSKSTNKFTVFSVKNYELYQSNNEQNYKQITSQNTNETQTINKQLTSPILKELKNIKNDKNGKNVKNDKEGSNELLNILLADFTDFTISEPLKEKMSEWLVYKTEKKQSYKETGLKTLLKKVANKEQEYGSIAVMDLIDECMERNYSGIIWDRLKNTEPQKTNFGDMWRNA